MVTRGETKGNRPQTPYPVGGSTRTRHPNQIQIMINQIPLKLVLIKVDGTWKKIYKEIPQPINSWKSIDLLIDSIFDSSIKDYTILHKPFTPILN